MCKPQAAVQRLSSYINLAITLGNPSSCSKTPPRCYISVVKINKKALIPRTAADQHSQRALRTHNVLLRKADVEWEEKRAEVLRPASLDLADGFIFKGRVHIWWGGREGGGKKMINSLSGLCPYQAKRPLPER